MCGYLKGFICKKMRPFCVYLKINRAFLLNLKYIDIVFNAPCGGWRYDIFTKQQVMNKEVIMYDTLLKIEELFEKHTDYDLSFMVILYHKEIVFSYSITKNEETFVDVKNSFVTNRIASANLEINRLKELYQEYRKKSIETI